MIYGVQQFHLICELQVSSSFLNPWNFRIFGCLESSNDDGCIGENGGQWYQGINEELRIDCGDSCQVDQGTNKIPSQLEKWKTFPRCQGKTFPPGSFFWVNKRIPSLLANQGRWKKNQPKLANSWDQHGEVYSFGESKRPNQGTNKYRHFEDTSPALIYNRRVNACDTLGWNKPSHDEMPIFLCLDIRQFKQLLILLQLWVEKKS